MLAVPPTRPGTLWSSLQDLRLCLSLWLPMTTIGESPAGSGSLVYDSVFLGACQWTRFAGGMCNMYWESVGPQGGSTLRAKGPGDGGRRQGSRPCSQVFKWRVTLVSVSPERIFSFLSEKGLRRVCEQNQQQLKKTAENTRVRSLELDDLRRVHR